MADIRLTPLDHVTYFIILHIQLVCQTETKTNIVSHLFFTPITVDTPSGIDVTPPVISGCPSDINHPIPPSQIFALVEWVEPTAADDVSGSIPVSDKTLDRPYIFVQQDSSPFTVSYTFVDEAGNEAVCLFTVRGIPRFFGQHMFEMHRIFIPIHCYRGCRSHPTYNQWLPR